MNAWGHAARIRLPTIVLAAGYVALGGRPVAGAVVFVLALLPPFVKGDEAGGSRLDVVVAIVASIVGASIATTFEAKTNLLGAKTGTRLHEAIALAALAAVAVRTTFAVPTGGRSATVAVTLAGVMALGAAKPAELYPYVVAVYVVAALVALRALDPVRPRLALLDRRAVLGVALAGVLAVGFSAALLGVLPPVHDRVQTFAIEQFGGGDLRRAGFDDSTSLGDLSAIIDSDGVALHVRGPRVDHLRGVVYTRYGNGRWFAPLGVRPDRIGATKPSIGAPVIIEHVGAPTNRFFAPLGVAEVGVPAGFARRDHTGLITPATGDRAEWIAFDPRVHVAIAPPEEDDVAVPAALVPELEKLAAEWTAGATTTADRAAAIEQHLLEYHYALQIPERARDRDPVLAFLFDHHTGHCEFFASSLALLLRTLGVPTRVVGGYRVVERNTVAEHWTVRNRNAHAWVEVWRDGAWATYDPTPPGELAEHMPERGTRFEELSDALGVLIRGVGAWILARILWLGPLLAIAAVLFLFRRELLAAWRGRRATAAPVVTLAYDDPTPAYRAVEALLARRGHRRAAHETLEAFSRRLEDDASVADAAPLVRRYAAARYGDDPATVTAALERYVGDPAV